MSSSASRARIAELLLIVFFLALFPAAGRAAPKVYLDITKEGGRKISMGLAPFSVRESATEIDLRKVLEWDLALSGYFDTIKVGPLVRDIFAVESESGKINFPTWSSWGAELLLRVTYRSEGDAVVIQGTLHDVAKRRLLFGREYRGQAGQGVRAVHSLANDVIKTLTGEEGVFLTRIAFAWAKDGGPKRITIMDHDGRGVRPVSPEGTLSLYPAWFPDGRRLAYVTYRHGRTEVVIHDLQTGRIRSLAFFPGMNAFPDISADGKSMLLTLSRDGNPEIYRTEVDGSSLKRLTFTKAVEASPIWSPDRRQMAFVSDRTGSPQIFVSSTRGGRARRVSYTGHYSTSPDWSPTGGQIVFTSLTKGTFQLFLIDMASGQNQQLTFDGGNKEDPAWAPNGRHIIFSQGRGADYRLFIIDSRSGEKFRLPLQGGSYTSPSWSQ